MLFEEILIKWLNEKENYVKESTYAYYSFEVKNYIIPMLGKIQAEEIAEEHIQTAVLNWQRSGMENGKPLKKSTVQNLVMLIKQVLKYAVRKGFMDESLMEIHFMPQANNNKKKKVFSPGEQNQIIKAVLSRLDYRSFGILLCINSGLRIGEVCALKWEDIDRKEGILYVTKTLQRIYMRNTIPHTQIIISEPKTLSSIREIPLSNKILDIINLLPDLNPKGYILSNSEHYIEPRTFRKYYDSFLKRENIKQLNFHCLRHTFATRCIENGADYKSISEILGHTTINTTLNMYVHPQMEEKRKCVEMIRWD
jgi:integrase